MHDNRPRNHLSARIIVLSVGVALAAAVGLWWMQRERKPNGVTISDLPIGSLLPKVAYKAVNASADTTLSHWQGCRVLVVFSPECPHCQAAAMRQAGDTANLGLPTAWLSDSDSLAVGGFVHAVGGKVPVFVATGAMRAFMVRAVPAAFLVTPEDRIALVFPYSRPVPSGRLTPYCARGSA